MTLLDALRLPWQPRPTTPIDSVATSTNGAEALPRAARVWILNAISEREVDLRLSTPRVSDSLNDADGAWIREPAGASDDAGWSCIRPDEVLVVIPPEHPTNRIHRLHRMARRVRIVVPPYEVIGSAHVQPGADAAAYLSRHGRAFVALTRASLRRDAEELGALPVVIVNLRAAIQLSSSDRGSPLSAAAAQHAT